MALVTSFEVPVDFSYYKEGVYTYRDNQGWPRRHAGRMARHGWVKAAFPDLINPQATSITIEDFSSRSSSLIWTNTSGRPPSSGNQEQLERRPGLERLLRCSYDFRGTVPPHRRVLRPSKWMRRTICTSRSKKATKRGRYRLQRRRYVDKADGAPSGKTCSPPREVRHLHSQRRPADQKMPRASLIFNSMPTDIPTKAGFEPCFFSIRSEG